MARRGLGRVPPGAALRPPDPQPPGLQTSACAAGSTSRPQRHMPSATRESAPASEAPVHQPAKSDIVTEQTPVPTQPPEARPKPLRSARQGIILRLVDLLSDNSLISNEDAAIAIGAHPETVKHLRKSDSFRTLVARAVKAKHGDLLYGVERMRLEATHAVLTAARDIAQAPEGLPTVKLQAAEIVLNDWHKTEDRKASPKLGQNGPPGTNVTVELTFNELQAARESAVEKGKTIQLEPSDVHHTPINPFTQHALLANQRKTGTLIREEGE